ncbi:MAG TPA: hypothetical protein DCZ94_16380 [Lentisphaeria bacterium]|nr:MAG: hypothetical protein A2X48_01955 [Lentisphaerae bacterium GWF2_49_21]HBC88525.1 hypothetical protein [Lentisphaeria bacterium]
MAATLKEISRISGVAISTVSRVLNKQPQRVSPETYEKIISTADKLRYSPNLAARSLVKGRSDSIGVFIPYFSDVIFSQYMDFITAKLKEHGLNVSPFCGRFEDETVSRCLNRQLDGLICMYYNDKIEGTYSKLKRSGFPIVFRAVDISPDDLKFDSVGIDISSGYKILCQHLYDQGCRKIGIIGGEISVQIRNNSCSGTSLEFLKTVSELGLDFGPDSGIPCENNSEAAYAKIKNILEKDARTFDAIIVQSNNKLPGVLKAVRDAGLKIPTDIAIASISDSDITRFANPPVTVWEQPIEKISYALADLMASRLKKENRAQRNSIRKITFNSSLIIRESTIRT